MTTVEDFIQKNEKRKHRCKPKYRRNVMAAVLNYLLQLTRNWISSISFIVGAESTSIGQPRRILDCGSRAAETPLISSRRKLFPGGATIVGFKMCGFVFLCAEGRVVDRNERILEENVVKLEWIWRRVIAKVRDHFRVNLPSSFDEIVTRLVEEANTEGDKVHWAEDLQYSFLVGGKLDHDPVCEMFHIKRIKKEDDPLFFRSQNKENHSHLYKSFPTDFVASGEEVEEFFGRKSMKSRLEQAKREYDRAEVAKIAKEYLAYACGIHLHSHGRAIMVTIHESGFHIFESARASRVNEFVPHGYAL